ncbi:MAG: aspartyl protease family protein [Patescibacteria group bacterium]
MKFKYAIAGTPYGAALLDSRGKMVKRPVLFLVLKGNKGESFKAPAIIDSGADTTTLHIQYAEALGISLDSSGHKDIMGIGKGKVPVYQGIFPFKIKEMGIDLKVPAWFVDSENVNILLGQEVFFERFKVKFEKDHDVFELVEVKK